MRIAIVGAGAMGSLYGGVLAENGHEVIFIDPYREHMQAVRENGLTIVKEGQSRVIRGMCAVEDAEGLDPVELLIVFVKSTLTGEAVRANRHLAGKDTMVLTLQNGLGNIEQLESVVDRSQILAGTSANGASLEGPGSIRHAGWGGTTIGEPDGTHSERIRRLADILGTGELGPVTVSDNVLGLIWDKLIANVGINPLTALTRLRNGELLEHPELEDWMESLVQEAAAVAQAEGIRLSMADPAGHCRSIAQATAGNISSMLADVLRNKRTEIDSINGAVVRIGKRHGIETPANALVTALIRGLEHTQL